jgi:hypothetical protein
MTMGVILNSIPNPVPHAATRTSCGSHECGGGARSSTGSPANIARTSLPSPPTIRGSSAQERIAATSDVRNDLVVTPMDRENVIAWLIAVMFFASAICLAL